MSDKIMAINSGSSSLKFQLYDMPEEKLLVKGLFERIGLAECISFTYWLNDKSYTQEIKGTTHEQAVTFLIQFIVSQKFIQSLEELKGVGHRIAHGGETFQHATVIFKKELQQIEALSHLAPLHNPVNAIGIKAFMKDLPDALQVGVFDTSFHQTMPEHNYIYPIPYHYYKTDKIRRYGFHGTSHHYVALQASKILESPLEKLKIISCHLGNGASVCGIKEGKSYITSMGFTPLAGLMMGTRCGDIDPSILVYLQKEKGLTTQQIDDLMNKESGFLGVSQLSNDSRDISKAAQNGNKQAQLAMNIFTSRVKQTIGAYAAELGGVDVLIFTAGIGENASDIREAVCDHLTFLGISIDQQKNKQNNLFIQDETATVNVLVLPTNEEVMIARETYRFIK